MRPATGDRFKMVMDEADTFYGMISGVEAGGSPWRRLAITWDPTGAR